MIQGNEQTSKLINSDDRGITKSGTELLAPAGDMSCLKAAIAAGADAVYLGGQKFGARAYAGNFSDEELLDALKLAHFFEKKVYLTINTLTKEDELKELTGWLAPFYEAGLDGVIIQDLGALSRCREAFPDLALHASTQMTVTESESALFLKSLGVERIVPARELSLEEIVLMKQKTGLELETFVHGALCYCYSGQCLFSSLLGGRSGNRGRCAQPCRLPYSVSKDAGIPDKKKKKCAGEQYPLSLKDLCTLPLLPRLLDAGIDSFKIEGRMKSPEYVAGVTAAYRKYIDLYKENPKAWSVDPRDLEFLSHLYVRSELETGYYERHNGREMITLQKPGYAGCSDEVLEEIRGKYLNADLTREVNMILTLEQESPAKLLAVCGDIAVEKEGMTVMAAQKRPLSKEDVKKQIIKLGGTHFALGSLDIRMQEGIFLPVSALNDLRRQALEELYGRIAAKNAARHAVPEKCTGRECGLKNADSEGDFRSINADIEENMAGLHHGDTAWYVSALRADQAMEAVQSTYIDRLYLAADAVLDDADSERLIGEIRLRKQKDPQFTFFLMLPAILRSYSEGYLNELIEWQKRDGHDLLTDGFLAGGLSGIFAAKRLGSEKKLSLQHSTYLFNAETWRFFMRHFQIDSYTAPLELNRQELKALPAANREQMVYGRIPMMISAGCVKKTAGDCLICRTPQSLAGGMKGQSRYFLTDRYQAEFPVFINCRHCMNTIYNSVPLSLHQYCPEIAAQKVRAMRLDFTDETAAEAGNIIRCFTTGAGIPSANYTTGHYKKGVQ